MTQVPLPRLWRNTSTSALIPRESAGADGVPGAALAQAPDNVKADADLDTYVHVSYVHLILLGLTH
jgi:hypothetical protein